MGSRNNRSMPYLPRYTPLSSRRPTFLSPYSVFRCTERVMYIGGSPSRGFNYGIPDNFSSPTRRRKIYLHSSSLGHYLTRVTESSSRYDLTSSHLYTHQECRLGLPSIQTEADHTGSSESIRYDTSYCPDLTFSESGVGESEFGSEPGWEDDNVSQNSLDSYSQYCETTFDSEMDKCDNESGCGIPGDRKRGLYNTDIDQPIGVRNRGHRHPVLESLIPVNDCKDLPSCRESEKVSYSSSPVDDNGKIHITSSTPPVPPTTQIEPSVKNVNYAGKLNCLVTSQPLSQHTVSAEVPQVPNLILPDTGPRDCSLNDLCSFSETKDMQAARSVSAVDSYCANNGMADKTSPLGNSCNNSCSRDITDWTDSVSDKTSQQDSETPTVLTYSDICDKNYSYNSKYVKTDNLPHSCDGTSSGQENCNIYKSRQTRLKLLIPFEAHAAEEMRRKVDIAEGVRKSPDVGEELESKVTLKKQEQLASCPPCQPEMELMDNSIANTSLISRGKHGDEQPRELSQTSPQSIQSPEKILTQLPTADTEAWGEEIREVSLRDQTNRNSAEIDKAEESQLDKSVTSHHRKCRKRRLDDVRLPDDVSTASLSVCSNSLHITCKCNHSFSTRSCLVKTCVPHDCQLNNNEKSKNLFEILNKTYNNTTASEAKRYRHAEFRNNRHNVRYKYIDGRRDNIHHRSSKETARKYVQFTNVNLSDKKLEGSKFEFVHFSDRAYFYSNLQTKILCNQVSQSQAGRGGFAVGGSIDLNETYSVCGKFLQDQRKPTDLETTADSNGLVPAFVTEVTEKCSSKRSGCSFNTLRQSDKCDNRSRQPDSYNTLRQPDTIFRQSDSFERSDNSCMTLPNSNDTLKQIGFGEQSECPENQLSLSDSFKKLPDNSLIQTPRSDNSLIQTPRSDNSLIQPTGSETSLRQSDNINVDTQSCQETEPQSTFNSSDASQSNSANGTISNSWVFPKSFSEQCSDRNSVTDWRSNVLKTTEHEYKCNLSQSNSDSESLLFCEKNNIYHMIDPSGLVTFNEHSELTETVLSSDEKDNEIISSNVKNTEHLYHSSATEKQNEVTQQLADSPMLPCAVIGSSFNSDTSFCSREWTTPSLNLNVNICDKKGDDTKRLVINDREKHVYKAQENRIDFYREIPVTILVKSITLSRDAQLAGDKGIHEAGHFCAERMGVAFVETGDELIFHSELGINQGSTSCQNIRCETCDETVNCEKDDNLISKEKNTDLGVHLVNDLFNNSVHVCSTDTSSEVVVRESYDSVITNTSTFDSILDAHNIVSLDRSLLNTKSISLCRTGISHSITWPSLVVKEEIDKLSSTTESIDKLSSTTESIDKLSSTTESVTSFLSPSLSTYQTETARSSSMKENRFSLSLKQLISPKTDLSSAADSFVTSTCLHSPLDDLQAQLSMISGDTFCGRTEVGKFAEYIVYQDCGQATTKQQDCCGDCIDIVTCLDVVEKLNIQEECPQKADICSKTGRSTEPAKKKSEFPKEQYDNYYDYDYLRSDSSTGLKVMSRPHHHLQRMKCGMLRKSSLWTLLEEPETVTDELSLLASPTQSLERQPELAGLSSLNQPEFTNKEMNSVEIGSSVSGQTSNKNCEHNSFVTPCRMADGSSRSDALFSPSGIDSRLSGFCERNSGRYRETEWLSNTDRMCQRDTVGHNQISCFISGHGSETSTSELINSSRACFSNGDFCREISDDGDNSVSGDVDHGLLMLDKLSVSLTRFHDQDEDAFDDKDSNCRQKTSGCLLDGGLIKHCEGTFTPDLIEDHVDNTSGTGSAWLCPREPHASSDDRGCVYRCGGIAELLQSTFSDYDNVPDSLKITTESSQTERTSHLNNDKLIHNIVIEQLEDLVSEPNAGMPAAKETSQIKPDGQFPSDCSPTNYEVLCTAFINDEAERNQNHTCITAEDEHLSIFRFRRFLKKSHSKRKNGRKVLRFFSKLMCTSENISPTGSPCVPRKIPDKSMSSYKHKISHPVLVSSTSIHHQDILNSSVDGSIEDCNQSSSNESLDSTTSRADSAYSSIPESNAGTHNGLENQSTHPLNVSSDSHSLISQSCVSFPSCGSSSHYINSSLGSLDSSHLQTGILVHPELTFDNSDSLEQSQNWDVTTTSDVFNQVSSQDGVIDTALLSTIRYGHKRI